MGNLCFAIGGIALDVSSCSVAVSWVIRKNQSCTPPHNKQLWEFVGGSISCKTWACSKIFQHWIYCIHHLYAERQTERKHKREKRSRGKDFVELMSSDSPLGGSAIPYWTLVWKEEIIHLSKRQSGTCRLIVIMLQVLQFFWYQFHWCGTVCFCTHKNTHTHIHKIILIMEK